MNRVMTPIQSSAVKNRISSILSQKTSPYVDHVIVEVESTDEERGQDVNRMTFQEITDETKTFYRPRNNSELSPSTDCVEGRRRSLPLELDLMRPVDTSPSTSNEVEPDTMSLDAPRKRRRIFASCIEPSARSVIKKLWLITGLFSIGCGVASAAMLQVIINAHASAATLSWYFTIGRSAVALVDIILMAPRTHYADAFGRKHMLYVSLIAYTVSAVIMAIHPVLITALIVPLITAIFSIFWTAIQAVQADVLPSRPKIIAQIDAYSSLFAAISLGTGFAIGFAVDYMTSIPLGVRFAAQAIFSVLSLVAVTSLPETLDENRKNELASRAFSETGLDQEASTWNVVKSIRANLRVIHLDDRIKWLLYSGFMCDISHSGGFGMQAAFLMEQLDFTERRVFMIFVAAAVSGTISTLCSGQLIKWFGPPVLMRISLVWMAVSKLALAFCPHEIYLYILMAIQVPFGFQYGVSRNSFITSITPSTYHARIKGAQGMLCAIATLVFANLYSLIFWLFTRDGTFFYFPGAAILVGALFRFGAIPFLLKAPIWMDQRSITQGDNQSEMERRASCTF